MSLFTCFLSATNAPKTRKVSTAESIILNVYRYVYMSHFDLIGYTGYDAMSFWKNPFTHTKNGSRTSYNVYVNVLNRKKNKELLALQMQITNGRICNKLLHQIFIHYFPHHCKLNIHVKLSIMFIFSHGHSRGLQFKLCERTSQLVYTHMHDLQVRRTLSGLQ